MFVDGFWYHISSLVSLIEQRQSVLSVRQSSTPASTSISRKIPPPASAQMYVSFLSSNEWLCYRSLELTVASGNCSSIHIPVRSFLLIAFQDSGSIWKAVLTDSHI